MIEAVWVFAFVVGVGALIAKLLAVWQMAKIVEEIIATLDTTPDVASAIAYWPPRSHHHSARQ